MTAARDRLAEALGLRRNGPASDGRGWFRDEQQRQECLADADALLPVVDAIAAERAADELEAEAAYDDAAPDEQYARYLFAGRLRQRAKNLRFDADGD